MQRIKEIASSPSPQVNAITQTTPKLMHFIAVMQEPIFTMGLGKWLLSYFSERIPIHDAGSVCKRPHPSQLTSNVVFWENLYGFRWVTDVLEQLTWLHLNLGKGWTKLNISSKTKKCDRTLRSQGTFQYFRFVHTKLWTARRLNFPTVKMVPCERNTQTYDFSSDRKFVWCRGNVALEVNYCLQSAPEWRVGEEKKWITTLKG